MERFTKIRLQQKTFATKIFKIYTEIAFNCRIPRSLQKPTKLAAFKKLTITKDQLSMLHQFVTKNITHESGCIVNGVQLSKPADAHFKQPSTAKKRRQRQALLICLCD